MASILLTSNLFIKLSDLFSLHCGDTFLKQINVSYCIFSSMFSTLREIRTRLNLAVSFRFQTDLHHQYPRTFSQEANVILCVTSVSTPFILLFLLTSSFLTTTEKCCFFPQILFLFQILFPVNLRELRSSPVTYNRNK